jgi:hypothetical protein
LSIPALSSKGTLARCCAFATLLGGSPLVAQSAPATIDERGAVLAVLQQLFDAMRTRDTARLMATFEPGARLVGMRPSREGGLRVQSLTARQFADFVARDTRAEWIERAWAPEVKVEGTLATVWAPYDFHFGTEPSHCGLDAVQLLKTGGGWRIVSLADTYQREGCPRRPRPQVRSR